MRKIAILAIAAMAVLGSAGAAFAHGPGGTHANGNGGRNEGWHNNGGRNEGIRNEGWRHEGVRENYRFGPPAGGWRGGYACCWNSRGIWFAPSFGVPYFEYVPVPVPPPPPNSYDQHPPFRTTVQVEVWDGRAWLLENRSVTAYYDFDSGRYYYVLNGVSYWL